MRRPASASLATPVFMLATIVWMWLAMMLTHELGHVFAAEVTGGDLTSVELRPGYYLSHTLVQPNPRPSVVLWSGFLVGWVVPQLTAPAWRIQSGFVGPTLRAWAAFCLLAGGAYLAIGGSERLTDTGQLIEAGWHPWLLVAVGASVAVVGYVRSRSAWIGIAKQLDATPPTHSNRLVGRTRGMVRRAGAASLADESRPSNLTATSDNLCYVRLRAVFAVFWGDRLLA